MMSELVQATKDLTATIIPPSLSKLWRQAEEIGKVELKTWSTMPKYQASIMTEIRGNTIFLKGRANTPEEALQRAIREAEEMAP